MSFHAKRQYFKLKPGFLGPKSQTLSQNGVLKYLDVESILVRLWKNQNGLGQKFAEVRHYGITIPTKTQYLE